MSSVRWGKLNSGADGAKRHRGCHADIDARKLTNIGKTEQIGHDQLAAAVFVGAVGMQSIAATAGLGIDQRDRQIVAAEKPGENVGCDRLPFGVALRPPGGQAGGDRRRWPPPAAGRTREAVGAVRRSRRCRWGGNVPSKPFVVSSANAGIAIRQRGNRVFAWPCLSASRLAAGAHCHTPGLPRTTSSPASRPTRGPTSISRQANAGFPGRAHHREQRRNSRPDPAG